ncbi:succinate dehydrogenase [Pajaroellobacter abortibovis]|uniref:Succinate dehydrogenase n=1 Tax=Pajaroellobacter abortibovis TaxID=1882918 RepID=A0A1L6MZ50_9BACT|nr:succinate dehydrogenase [Pajaroellobacter abortibovis]APS00802.1 succinate dehydrogenase [Pajaroellobacter abortibovis]
MTKQPAPDTIFSQRSTFLRARLASFLAFAPLTIWTFLHVWNNLAAYRGAEAWQTSVTTYPHPFAHLFTLMVVLLPLVLHTIWGISRLSNSRPNNTRYTFYANFKYLLQRISAIGVLLFIGAHVWLAMLQPRLTLGHPEYFTDIAREMRYHFPTLIVYLLGTLGVAYHVGNGLSSFAMGWGFVLSRQALRRLEWVSILSFFLLLAMSWGAIYALWQAGSALLPLNE